jgi:chemotaxis protein methyltransferase WspC
LKQSRLSVPSESLPQKDRAKTGYVSDSQSEAEKLATVRALADAGSLDRALTMCRQFLKKHEHNKEAYYLMGLINLALNSFDKAETFFQKVLYLDPRHYEALIHMKLLYEKKGDQVKASAMKGRIERSEERI